MTDTLSRPAAQSREELANLAAKADTLHDRLMARLYDDVRAALNEAKLLERGRACDDALDIFDKAQLDRRNAEAEAAKARDELDAAAVAARWELSGKVTKEGNKILVPDGHPDNSERREVTAAVRDEWIESQVTQHPAVAKARDTLRKAEHKVAEAKDALERARLAIGIRRTQADLAGIHVQAIAGALKNRGDQ